MGQSTFLFDVQNRLIELMIGDFPCIGNTVLVREIPLPRCTLHKMLHDCGSTYVPRGDICRLLHTCTDLLRATSGVRRLLVRSEKPDDMHKA